MSCGVGIIHSKASKQKLNTKITTESEVVAVSEYVPYKIRVINIFGVQGYVLHKNVLDQYNESAIKMEKNGQNSCTVNSRHISIRYFFVNGRVDNEEFSFEYCSTSVMLSDFFNKTLQESFFRRLR